MARGAQTFRSSLSSRLLLLTICFVMVVEIFVWVPSVAQFRRSFLEQRMIAAQIAALSLLEVPQQTVSIRLEEELLATAGVRAVTLMLENRSQLMLRGAPPDHIDADYDLRDPHPFTLMRQTFETLARGGKGLVRVVGVPQLNVGQHVAIILEEEQLFQEMLRYSRNVLLLSVVISLVTAALVFLSINWLLVRPMRRITHSMVEFSKHPSDTARVLVPSARKDEVGIAERELAEMQKQLQQALNQRSRLANLGIAVSKVNHDLRNILATAHLSSDRLLMIDDPKTRLLSQRLIRAIDRAIDLCERTLKYGRADEPPPHKRDVDLHALAADVGLSLGLGEEGGELRFTNAVPPAFTIHADPDHLFRVLLNLGRNAVSACNKADGRIEIRAFSRNGSSVIEIEDNGPGLAEATRETLFMPFRGSASAGGSGLGLSIVADLVNGHGGSISLARSDASGSVFTIELPEAPADLD